MMSENWVKAPQPFLMHFSEEIKRCEPTPVRYNKVKNLMEAYQNGSWVNLPAANFTTQGSTKVTRVNQETTDDE